MIIDFPDPCHPDTIRRVSHVKRSARTYLGIDVGKTHYRVGIVQGTRELVAYVKRPYAHDGASDLSRLIVQTADELLGDAGVERDALGGVGLALPAIVDRKTGTVIKGPDWDFMTGASVSDVLSRHFGCPVVTEADPVAATWGELAAGVGLECERFAVLTWGTSVGAGLVIDGEVVTYANNLFPEFGHAKVSDYDRPCICGGRGCFATMVSGPGIAQSGLESAEQGRSKALGDALSQGAETVTASMVFDAAEAGDRGAREVLERVGVLFGRMYANLVYACQPERIVVSGGLTPRFPAIEPTVRRSMEENCWLIEGGYTTCEPVMSTLEDTAGVLGAARQASARMERSE